MEKVLDIFEAGILQPGDKPALLRQCFHAKENGFDFVRIHKIDGTVYKTTAIEFMTEYILKDPGFKGDISYKVVDVKPQQ